MFLKKQHLEALSDLSAAPQERLIELYILGLIDLEGMPRKFEKPELTEAGREMLEIVERLDLEKLPEVFADSEVIKMIQLAVETGHIPEEWLEYLKERQLADENGVNENARKLLEIYGKTHPRLFLTKEIVDFLRKLPSAGDVEELVACRDTAGIGENVINALQAMRMLLISPRTSGKAYALTRAAELAMEVAKYTSFDVPVILSEEDMNLMRSGIGSESLKDRGMWNGGLTNLGKSAMDTYDAMGVKTQLCYPIYLLEDEIEVLNTIKEIERINQHTPDILPTYSEIERRANVQDLGAILHLLESKELIERRFMKNRDTYWTTEWSEIAEYGVFTSDAVKALTFPLSGDVPTYEWVREAKNEGLLQNGITKKGRKVLAFTRGIERKPYLTKYDIEILSKIPRRYIHRDELASLVSDAIRALGECESKGWVFELQNRMIGLTPMGDKMKRVVETANLTGVKFAVTPTTFNVLKVIHDNLEVFNKIWKESSEIRNYKQDEVDFIKKKLSLSEEEIKKALTVLRATGLLGRKSVTEAGKTLVEAYSS